MTFINPAVVEGARLAIREATETALSTLSSVATSIATPSAESSLPPTAVTLTSAAPSPTDSSTLANGGGATPGSTGGSGNNNNSGSNSSSLLFFVALGFGVVFTNLWIIVGVKYCFRYNARNRQLRTEDGDPINMENMPRPHRRRREKKLMPIDEVNEKFPMLKYKSWVATRANEGLPTRGGVSAPPSRSNSIRDADGVAPELPPKERVSTDDRPTTSATTTGDKPAAEITAAEATVLSNAEPETPEKPEAKRPQHAPKESTSSTVGVVPRTSMDPERDVETSVAHKHMSQVSHDDDYDDDDHIDAALPPECMTAAGDTCAICIDTLEDDDDVRGLTCGHAFHAACIDPWLTTRRACCPLCKADYYTPKPRPQAADGGDGTTGIIAVTLPGDSRRNNRANLPGRPRHAFFGFGRSDQRTTTYYASSRRRTTGGPRPRDDGNHAFGRSGTTRNNTESTPTSPTSTGESWAGGVVAGIRAALPSFRTGRGQNTQASSEPVVSGANPGATPSQLEAGTRTAA